MAGNSRSLFTFCLTLLCGSAIGEMVMSNCAHSPDRPGAFLFRSMNEMDLLMQPIDAAIRRRPSSSCIKPCVKTNSGVLAKTKPLRTSAALAAAETGFNPLRSDAPGQAVSAAIPQSARQRVYARLDTLCNLLIPVRLLNLKFPNG